jgi:hypothetical protein
MQLENERDEAKTNDRKSLRHHPWPLYDNYLVHRINPAPQSPNLSSLPVPGAATHSRTVLAAGTSAVLAGRRQGDVIVMVTVAAGPPFVSRDVHIFNMPNLGTSIGVALRIRPKSLLHSER